MAKAKVTLEYDLASGDYHVKVIRGIAPTVDYYKVGEAEPNTARVGDRLTEDQARDLGMAADLTVQRYTV